MWNMNDVTEISYRGGYRYHILFDDGTAGELDFTSYLSQGPVFAPLKAPELFRQAKVEGGTIVSGPCGGKVASSDLPQRPGSGVARG